MALPSPKPARGHPVQRLRRIVRAGVSRLVILTGRPAAAVERLLVNDRTTAQTMPEIWGCHGYERKRPAEPVHSGGLPAATQRALRAGARCAERLGWNRQLEAKSASLAAHSRGLGPVRAARLQRELGAAWGEVAARRGLRLQRFDGGLELKARQADKGAAVAALVAGSPTRCPIAYLGDDLTDEDAFAALPGHGLAVLVRAKLRPTRAHVWLRPPEEVLTFLDLWHRLTTQEAPHRQPRGDGSRRLEVSR